MGKRKGSAGSEVGEEGGVDAEADDGDVVVEGGE